MVIRHLLFSFAILVAQTASAQDADVLGKKIAAAVKELSPAEAVLKPADFDESLMQDPPSDVTSAGPEFVAAWREFQRAMCVRRPKGAGGAIVQINAASSAGRAQYGNLLQQLLHGTTPPAPETFDCFDWRDNSWCGTPAMEFWTMKLEATILAHLRNRQPAGALYLILRTWSHSHEVCTELLERSGFDPDLVNIGGWLASGLDLAPGDLDRCAVGFDLENISKQGTEKTARLLLQWAEANWPDEAALRKIKAQRARGKLAPPTTSLLHFFAKDKAISAETKKRLAALINARGREVDDDRDWLRLVPEGAAPFFKSLAHQVIKEGTNESKMMALKVLRQAGEDDVAVQWRQAPSYQVFVNGALWRLEAASECGLNVVLNYPSRTETSREAAPDMQGMISLNPDWFAAHDLLSAAFVSRAHDANDTTRPWFTARIPLPPRDGETTVLHVETIPITIRPRFPRPDTVYQGHTTRLEFCFSDGGGQVFELEGTAPLVLPSVQQGNYVIRVTARGAVRAESIPIVVAKGSDLFTPELAIAATAIVPIQWSENLSLEALPPEITDAFERRSWAGLPEFFVLERDGKPCEWPSSMMTFESAKIPRAVVFANLPKGAYRVVLRSSEDIASGLGQRSAGNYRGWKATAISFDVTDASPVEIPTESLRVTEK